MDFKKKVNCLLPIFLIAGLGACTNSVTVNSDGTGGTGSANQTNNNSSVLNYVDCASDSANIKCTGIKTSNAGKVGNGPAFYQGGLRDYITGGFVSGDKLIASVEYGGQQDTLGAILSIDLKTGNRTLISGIIDANNKKGSGVMYKGSSSASSENSEAYDLGFVRDVKPLAGGKYAALVNKGVSSRTEILEIDPASGDRKLLWASNYASDTHTGGLRSKEASIVNTNSRCIESDGNRVINPESAAFEVDSNGNFYLQAGNNPAGSGNGTLRISNGKCDRFSMYNATNLKSESGSGYIQASEAPMFLSQMVLNNNKLYYTSGPNPSGNVLTSTDINSGERVLVSTKDRVESKNKGTGDGTIKRRGVAVNGMGIWTTGGSFEKYFTPVVVEASTGNRTTYEAKSGPLKTSSDEEQVIFSIPGSNILLVQSEHALSAFDPGNGNSFIVSQ